MIRKQAFPFKYVLLIVMIFSSLKLSAQAPGDWLWAKSIGGSGSETNFAAATDPQGNIVVCGNYSTPSLTIGSNTFTHAGGGDFYVAKYDPNGNVLWARSSGGQGYDKLNAIAIDAAGNIFVTGGSNSAELTIGDTTILLGGMILIKYNSAGDVVRVKVGHGGSTYDGEAIAVDQQGNVFVTGTFYPGSISFDTNVYASSVSGNDTYLVKYNNDCLPLWAKGSNAEHPGGITVDKANNIYLTAYSRFGSVNFGSIMPSNPDLTNNNIYLAKFTTDGNVIWARTAIGNKDDYVYGIDTDDSCNFYITGFFTSDSLMFDNVKLKDGVGPMYVAKFDSSGNAVWGRTGTDAAMGNINVDISGNIYASGTMAISSFTIGSTHLVNHNGSYADGLILKFNSNGDLKWAQLIGGNNPDLLNGVATDLNGDVYYAGAFSSPVSLGNLTLTNTASSTDAFLFKLHPSPDPVSFCPPAATTSISLNAIGNDYQWQADTGTGYVDITDNANYAGTNTVSLQLINIPSSWYGYKYRCLFDGHYSSEYTIKFTDTWTGAVSNVWEDTGNWSCGTVPDQNTDVIIKTGTVQINSDITIRTLTISSGASVNVATGFNLTVLH